VKFRLFCLLALIAGWAVNLFAQCPNSGGAVPQTPSGNTGIPASTPITFTWTAATASGVTSYEAFNVTTNNVMCTAAPSATSCTGSGLSGGVYNWEIHTKVGACVIGSTQKTFIIGCPNTAPTIQSPADGATNTSTNATLTWSAVSAADSYDIFIAQASVNGCPSLATASTSNTSFTTQLSPGTRYQWRVAAKKSGTNCPTPSSSCVVFTTAAPAANCPTQPPTLVAPANGAANVTSPVIFDWNDVSGATFYRLMAAFNGGTANPIAITRDTEYSTSVPTGSVEWWVETIADNCQTLGSTHFRFTTAGGTAGCPSNPQSPTLTAPAAGATVNSPVTFTWTAVAGASSYRVWAATANASTVSLLGNSSTTAFTSPLPQGTVVWYVEARFDNCPSTFSPRGSFNVASPTVCNNSPTTLIAPANNATNVASPVTFNWTAVPNAIGYKVFVGGENVAVTANTTISLLVPQGTVTWWVDTAFAGCADQHSAEFKFTVAGTNCPTGSIALTSPGSGATVTSPVTYAWSGITGATAYRIWVSVDGSAPQLSGRVNSTNTSLPTPSGNIVWQVEALFNNCPSIFSPRGNFTVGRGTSCGQNGTATLVSPISGSQTDTSVDFNWTNVQGTIGYRVWASTDGQPFADLGVTSNSHLKHDMDPGVITWYVESIFGGCPVVPSARATFTLNAPACAIDPPLLISPADGATNVTAPVTLVWSAVSDVKQYRVFASVNGSDFSLISITTDTSLTKPIPPGMVTWFVEATFKQCPSLRSTRSRFTIARAAQCSPQAPQLVAPVNNAANVQSLVLLNWDPVSGAVGYQVFARFNGGTPTRIGETADTELSRDMPEGSFEWWVVAFFAGCPPTESAHFSFVIPASGCSNRRSILWSPAEGDTGLTSPVRLRWSKIPGARSYKVWAAVDGQSVSLIGTTPLNELQATLPSGTIAWRVDAVFDTCSEVSSAPSFFTIRKTPPACGTPDRPLARVAGQVESDTPFTIHWTAVANSSSFDLQESTTADFSNATSQVIDGLSASMTKTVADQPVRYYYRVRANSSCSDEHGHYSKIISVVIHPQKAKQTSVDVGVQSGITQQIAIPGQNPPVNFSARADKPWITVTPATGTIGPQGTTLNVTYDPASLKLGTNTGTVILTFGNSGTIITNAVAPVIPVSVSLVTPVAPAGKNGPPPDSLIIPAVGHAPGANNSLFESDVRVANVSAQTQKYQLNFTLSATDGTQSGQSSTIEIEPGATMALDDILANFFGIGSDGTAATGVLEIRPLTSSTSNLSSSATPSIQTVASSRTYNTTTNGTFGQFIPAVPFSQFIGAGSRLSLQQIAQSAAYRTNFGLVEAAGEPASVLIHVFNNSGQEIVSPIAQNLLPSEHLQLNNFLSANGVSLTDGRLEVEVTSSTGKVTAYASVVDNVTNDPLLVSPVLKGGTTATRYVLPGVGDFDIGIAHWKSDVRVFNSAQTSQPVTLSYYAQGDPTHPLTSTMTLQPGETRAMDNLIATTWPQLQQTAGSLLVTSANSSALVATARTYTQLSAGTYGQFIPAVTTAQSAGNGERSLQLLQLEASDRYRTNIGVAETSGNAATAHVSLILPDSKFAISTDIPLAANEFKQFSLSSFGAGTVYNGRVTVTVISGTGRVTAYGSVIDQLTQDPTYVPAQ
jgi:hypothetical protein